MVMGEAGIGVSMRPVPGYGVNEDIRVFHGLPHSHRCFGGVLPEKYFSFFDLK